MRPPAGTSDSVGIHREMAARLYLEMEAASDQLLVIEREVRDALESVGQAADAPALIAATRTWLDETALDVRRRALLIEPPDGFIGPLTPANLINGLRPTTAPRPVFDPFNNGWTSRNPPRAHDAKLRRTVDNLYRPQAKVGSGSTADALRAELADQVRHSRSGHYEKTCNTIHELERIRVRAKLSPGDARIVEGLLRDLRDAKGLAEATARKQGRSPQHLLDGYPRRGGNRAAAKRAGGGAAKAAAVAAGLVGRFFTPLILPDPCSLDSRVLRKCPDKAQENVA